MPDARYFVVRNQDRWFIKYDREEFGPYQTQAEATLFAVEAAHKFGRKGNAAQVCLMGDDGHFRQEWTSGKDAYPPRL